MEESCDVSSGIEAAGLKLEVDHRIPLTDYYDLATDLLHQAAIHREKNKIAQLYISLLRFLSLVTESLPNHQDYNIKYSRQRHSLTQKACNAKKELELLEPKITYHLDKLNSKEVLEGEHVEERSFPSVIQNLPYANQSQPEIDIKEPSTSSICSGNQNFKTYGNSISDHPTMNRQASIEDSQPSSSPPVDSSCKKDPKLDDLGTVVEVCNVEATSFLGFNACFIENREEFPNFDNEQVDHTYYAQLQLLTADITSLTKEVFGLILSSQQSEKDAKEAVVQAKRFECLYKVAIRERNRREQELTSLVLKLDKLRAQQDELLYQLRIAQEEKANVVTRMDKLDDELKTSKYLMNLLKKERDGAREEMKVLKLMMVPPKTEMFDNILHFSVFEIEQGTFNFDNDLKIGEGRSTCVYRGFIRSTSVAIKKFDESGVEGKQKFHQELDALARLRHPHFVSIIGSCPEALCLVYEYASNGSLEDCLGHRGKSSTLSWSVRIRIASEVCSSLNFFHSCNPIIIHGNLRVTNILLDANFMSKVCDLRCLQFISEASSGYSEEMLAYIDPWFFSHFELTTCSDVYSFGIIVLRLLTGLPASMVVGVVKEALTEGELQNLLDDSAGEWPFIQASQLAHLGLRCCEESPSDRPNFEEVCRVLEPIARATSLVPSPLPVDDMPSYFICPIIQEIMREPHMAADGFTYEAEAIQAWFDSGHNTSPMTNLKLPHQKLLPNHALKSAIKDWLQKYN